MNLPSNTADRQITLPGRPEITVLLRPSRRASRLSLRISRLKGQVTLSLPLSCPMVQAENFILEKESWIRAHLADLPLATQAGFDRQLPFAGRHLTICPGAGRQVERKGDRLLVPGRESLVAARVKAFLKLQARLALQEAVDHYSQRLGRPYGRLTLRDTTSRWGSCSTQGNLNFSWRLIMAPPEVLRYVAGPLQALSGGRMDASILRQLLIAVAMISIMLLRPKGLWPAPEHGRSLQKPKA